MNTKVQENAKVESLWKNATAFKRLHKKIKKQTLVMHYGKFYNVWTYDMLQLLR